MRRSAARRAPATTGAVWSPGLDASDNALPGTDALACLAEEMDWSVFGASGLPDEKL